MINKEKLRHLRPVAENAHRELTHGSIALPGWLQKVIRLEQNTYGLDANNWAAAHRIHHEIPDASLAPHFRIARAIHWMGDNSTLKAGVTIPETFPHLDPYVPEFERADVLTIGDMAIKMMKKRMKGQYQEAKSYTHQELEEILYPKKPQYFYPKEMSRPYSQDDIADLLLSDPHSPALVGSPEGNGVRFILKSTTGMYEHLTHLFADHPEFMPDDLQHPDGKAKKYGWQDFAVGFAVPSLAFLFGEGAYTPKGVLGAALKGSAVNGTRLLALYFGGKVVNALGHAGLEGAQVMKILNSEEYKPKLNPDGTITTGTAIHSLVGRIATVLTFDEVGGQGAHHADGSRIAYTDKAGIQRWIDAPFGSFIDVLARSKYFPLIQVGDNFNLEPEQKRPDQAHEAVVIIQKLRAEQLARKSA